MALGEIIFSALMGIMWAFAIFGVIAVGALTWLIVCKGR